jgi:pimeloyl-ACP methyl ester carboxylesterase
MTAGYRSSATESGSGTGTLGVLRGQRPSQVGFVEHNVITNDGVTLYVRDVGSNTDARHTVVLLHGLCLNQDAWAPQVARLIRHWGNSIRIVSYDHRGHGGSGGGPTHDYQIERLGADLAEVLETLNITGPVTIAGHSMGGMAALAYLSRPAAERPIEPDGLVLVATGAGRLAERGLGRLLATPAPIVLDELVNRAPRILTDHLMRTITRPLCTALNTYAAGTNHAERQTLIRLISTRLAGTPLATAVGFLTALRRYDAYNVLPAITARTVVVSGGADILTPTAHALDLIGGIPGATHLHRPAASHMLLHEAPDLVVDAINRTICAQAPVGSAAQPQPTARAS